MALYHSQLSKDPRTRVGSIITGPDREILSAGFNGFPRGIADTDERLADQQTALKLMVHAEMNALLAAARTGMRLKGCTLYLAATDDTGLVWGGPPCTRCTVEIIQVGISEIVSHPAKNISRWREDLVFAGSLIKEAGVAYHEVPYRGCRHPAEFRSISSIGLPYCSRCGASLSEEPSQWCLDCGAGPGSPGWSTSHDCTRI